MSINLKIGIAALCIAASSTSVLAQATGKENNATSGSEAGSGPASGAEQKGSMKGQMKPSSDTVGSAGAGSAGAPSGAYGTADKPMVGDKNDASNGSGK